MGWMINLFSDNVTERLDLGDSNSKNALEYLRDLYVSLLTNKGFKAIHPLLESPEPASKGDYDLFVKEMKEKHIGGFELTDAEIEHLTTGDLTPAKLFKLTELMRRVAYHVIEDRFVRRGVRKVADQYDPESENVEDYEGQSIDELGEQAQAAAKASPEYDPAKLQEGEKKLSPIQLAGKNLGDLASYIANIFNVVERADGFKPLGFFQTNIGARLKGTGEFEGDGLIEHNRIEEDIKSRLKAGIKKYGRNKFYRNSFTKISKASRDLLKPYDRLNNGKLTKRDMVTIQMNMGNQGNIDRVKLYGAPIDLIRHVLRTELTKADFDYVQDTIWKIYDDYKGRLDVLERRMEGKPLNEVVPKPFQEFGRVYQGGYVPILLKRTVTEEQTKAALEDAEVAKIKPGEEEKGLLARLSFRSRPLSVYHPETLERREQLDREGYYLDLDRPMRGFDILSYDLAMRIPVDEVNRMLAKKEIREAIISVVGISDYNVIKDTLTEMTNSQGKSHQALFREAERVTNQLINGLNKGVIKNLLSWSPSTYGISFSALFEIAGRMGHVDAARYLWPQIPKMMLTYLPFYGDETFQAMKKIDPSIGKYMLNLEQDPQHPIQGFMAKNRIFKGPVKGEVNYLLDTYSLLVEWGVGKFLGSIDLRMKTIGIIGLRKQFLDGNVQGYSYQTLSEMTEEQRGQLADRYASDVIEKTTLESTQPYRSSFQKNPVGAFFSVFWNEPRAILNNRVMGVRRGKLLTKEALSLIKQGKFDEANEKVFGVAEQGMNMMITMFMVASLFRVVLGDDPLRTAEEEGEDLEGGFTTTEQTMRFYNRLNEFFGFHGVGEALDQFGGNLPMVRTLLWTAETGLPPSTPTIKAIDQIGQTVKTGIELAEYLNPNDEYSWGELMELMTFGEILALTSDSEKKNFLGALGILAGGKGVPYNAWYKWKEILKDEEGEIPILDYKPEFLDQFEDFLRRHNIIDRDVDPKLKEYMRKLKEDIKGAMIRNLFPRAEAATLDLALMNADDVKAIGQQVARNPAGLPVKKQGLLDKDAPLLTVDMTEQQASMFDLTVIPQGEPGKRFKTTAGFSFEDLLKIISQGESSGIVGRRPIDRKTGKFVGSARGLFQVIESTFNKEVLNSKTNKELPKELQVTMADYYGLATQSPEDRYESEMNIGKILLREHINNIRKDKHPVSLNSIYTYHHFGEDQANRFYRAIWEGSEGVNKTMEAFGILENTPEAPELKGFTNRQRREYLLLNKILTPKVRKNNPKLRPFTNFKQLKGFLENHLNISLKDSLVNDMENEMTDLSPALEASVSKMEPEGRMGVIWGYARKYAKKYEKMHQHLKSPKQLYRESERWAFKHLPNPFPYTGKERLHRYIHTHETAEAFLGGIAHLESGNNDGHDLIGSGSTARTRYTIIDSTLTKILDQYGGREKYGLTKQGVYNDPKKAKIAAKLLLAHNIGELHKAGIPITSEGLYMAWAFGDEYTVKHWNRIWGKGSNPNSPLPEGMITELMKKLNPQMEALKTVGNLRAYLVTLTSIAYAKLNKYGYEGVSATGGETTVAEEEARRKFEEMFSKVKGLPRSKASAPRPPEPPKEEDKPPVRLRVN